jgi:hypothetical protein
MGFIEKKYSSLILPLVLALSSIVSLYGQKLEGVYSGHFGAQVGVIELKKSGDLVIGVIYIGFNEKSFFYALAVGASFSNHAMLNLGDSPFVKGEIKDDTLHLSLDSRDSSYAGKFNRIRKKEINEVVNEAFKNLSKDSNLVGEWICIGENAPEKSRNIGYKLILLENGVVVPDYAYLKNKMGGQNRNRSYSIDEMKNAVGNITWYTIDNKQFVTKHESSFLSTEEILSTYELKNDTLRLTNIKNFTSVYVKVNVKKKNSD